MCAMDQWVNRVIEGDCLEVMADFPPASIDMVLADLPYGLTHNPWDSMIDLIQVITSSNNRHNFINRSKDLFF